MGNAGGQFSFDGTMDRLLGETRHDATGGVARAAAWTYDAVGNRASASNEAGTAALAPRILYLGLYSGRTRL